MRGNGREARGKGAVGRGLREEHEEAWKEGGKEGEMEGGRNGLETRGRGSVTIKDRGQSLTIERFQESWLIGSSRVQ